ncbi:hypothetical protein ACFV27_37360 [Streptomyces antimycoticus]|uniref:hypothetical protein n=1 Tax=Streptomyces antimycoticus TaxID=68175 RepID=UPI0036B415C8
MTTTIEPPADAVAKDAHWAAKLERLRNRTRPTLTLRICDDQAAKDALATAQYAERRIKETAEADPDSPESKKAVRTAAAEVKKAQAAVDEASIVLTFRALERTVLAELKKQHPATEEQAEDGYEFNPDTLGPALVAASSVDGLTEDDARLFLETWSDAEAEALLAAAFNVQAESRMDLGKG